MADLASQSCPRLRVEGDASLICLACFACDRHCNFLASGPSWRQLNFLSSLSAVLHFPDDICSGRDFSPHKKTTAARSTQCMVLSSHQGL